MVSEKLIFANLRVKTMECSWDRILPIGVINCLKRKTERNFEIKNNFGENGRGLGAWLGCLKLIFKLISEEQKAHRRACRAAQDFKLAKLGFFCLYSFTGEHWGVLWRTDGRPVLRKLGTSMPKTVNCYIWTEYLMGDVRVKSGKTSWGPY